MAMAIHSTDASRAGPPGLPTALTDALMFHHHLTMTFATKANAKDKDKDKDKTNSQS